MKTRNLAKEIFKFYEKVEEKYKFTQEIKSLQKDKGLAIKKYKFCQEVKA